MHRALLFLGGGIIGLFGIFFLSLLAHEGVHVAQSKEPISICYDMQQNSFMHVSHDTDDWSDFKTFVSYSEKSAAIVERLIGYGLALLAGLFLAGRR
ncbi:MAG: hypothetical protein R6V53_04875 [Candidatus Woesearchaeota archaeon]